MKRIISLAYRLVYAADDVEDGLYDWLKLVGHPNMTDYIYFDEMCDWHNSRVARIAQEILDIYKSMGFVPTWE